MAKLQDLVKLKRSVRIQEQDFDVHPLSLATLGSLVLRFKGLADVLEGGGDIVEAIVSEGDSAVVAVAAAALRESEDDVRSIVSPVEQLDVILSSLELTLPEDPVRLGETIARAVLLAERVAGALGRKSSNS
jgi:hypothetical protein